MRKEKKRAERGPRYKSPPFNGPGSRDASFGGFKPVSKGKRSRKRPVLTVF